jgi:uncharacterized protein YjlB
MQIKTAVFADDGTFPNSRLPLVLYIDAVPEATADGLEGLFSRNGWPPAWRASVFPYQHYHSRSHECLGVAQGRARLQFGGPAGQAFEVKAGDVVVIPAGVAHQRLDASADFLVVGCYPPGQQNGEPVGTLQITLVPGLLRLGMWRGLLESVHVVATRRNQGLGARMVRWALEECRRLGCGMVQLTSNKLRLDAHRFYERLGFEKSHKGFKYYL